MPFSSQAQRAWAHTAAGAAAGFTPERIAEWDAATGDTSLPARAPKKKKKQSAKGISSSATASTRTTRPRRAVRTRRR